MKLSIIGSGMIVTDFLSIIDDLPEIKLESIIGTKRSEDKLKEMVPKYGFKAYYTDAEEALAKDASDTVYVAVPNHLHYSFTKLALKMGKNVICEKPFTLESSELKELVALAEEKNLILLEAITNQYLGNFEKIKETLPSLGDIKIVECNYSQYSSRYDAFKRGEILPVFDPKKGGGALMDINIYNIHLVTGLFGKPKSAQYLANVERDIDTSGMLVLDYGDKKIVCIGAKDSSSDIRTTIQGNKGSLVINGATNTLPSLTITYNNELAEEVNHNQHPHRMYSEFKIFNQVIEEKDFEFAKKALQHSLIVMEIVDQAKASM